MAFGRRGASAAAAGLLVLGSAARAAPPSDTGPPVSLPLDQDGTSAVLTMRPGNADLQREYPPVALRMNLGGSSTMTCRALATGRLDDCHVVAESPVGAGFGAAEVRTSVYFRVRPATRDGRPVDGVITIPMRWMAEGHAPPPPQALPPASPAALALARRVVALERTTERAAATWRPFLDQQAALAAGRGDGTALVDAYRQGLADALQVEGEREAHELASRESEADLKATVAFLETPAGRAWTAAEVQSSADGPPDFSQRVAEAAREHYCPGGTCPGAGAASAAR